MEQLPGDVWASELTAVVAQQIKRHRERLGLSAQRLSDACEAVGYPVPRALITKLENGYRKYVTLAELAAIADALDVPVPVLLAPLEDSAPVPVVPHQSVSPAAALAWLRGDLRLRSGEEPIIYASLRTYVQAYEATQELHRLLGQWGPENKLEATHPPTEGAPLSEALRPPGWHERFNGTVNRLQEYRSQLRALNYPRPPLPMGLEWIDQESSPPVSGGH